MKELLGKRVLRIVELNVEGKLNVFGEVLKEIKFKTGNKLVTMRVKGIITNTSENSVEVYMERWCENGINASGWYEKSKFERLFEVI